MWTGAAKPNTGEALDEWKCHTQWRRRLFRARHHRRHRVWSTGCHRKTVHVIFVHNVGPNYNEVRHTSAYNIASYSLFYVCLSSIVVYAVVCLSVCLSLWKIFWWIKVKKTQAYNFLNYLILVTLLRNYTRVTKFYAPIRHCDDCGCVVKSPRMLKTFVWKFLL